MHGTQGMYKMGLPFSRVPVFVQLYQRWEQHAGGNKNSIPGNVHCVRTTGYQWTRFNVRTMAITVFIYFSQHMTYFTILNDKDFNLKTKIISIISISKLSILYFLYILMKTNADRRNLCSNTFDPIVGFEIVLLRGTNERILSKGLVTQDQRYIF